MTENNQEPEKKKDEKQPDLGINAAENISAAEKFGRMDKQLKGCAGTLHLTNMENYGTIIESAWKLSEDTGLPTIVVVRAPRKV